MSILVAFTIKFPPTGVRVFSLHTGVLFFFATKEDHVVTLEMVNRKGQVTFFTVTLEDEKSFIEEMGKQGWLVLGWNYDKED